MKAIKTIWLSTLNGSLGIVLCENDRKEKSVRISRTAGLSEKYDIQEVIDYGAKISLSDAKAIVKHLEVPLLCEDCQEVSCDCNED